MAVGSRAPGPAAIIGIAGTGREAVDPILILRVDPDPGVVERTVVRRVHPLPIVAAVG